MKVLITGGAGFIGSNLVHYLTKNRPKWDLIVLDVLSYSGNLANINNLIETGAIKFSHLDICDESSIKKLFQEEQFNLVFHLAAESHVDRSIHSSAEFVRSNILGTQVLLEVARNCKVDRFVHISTDEVYGSLGDEGVFYENTPLDPTSPYAASKASSDLLALAFNKTYGLEVVVTRCTNNYGPYQFPEKFIPLFITNAMEQKKLPLYGDGMHVRSWLHVEDHCSALLKVAEGGVSGEVYNIGGDTDSEIPNLIVAQQILRELNVSESLINLVQDRLAHDRRYAVDTTKIRRELGWTTTIKFDKGLKDTVNWYKNNQKWWLDIRTGEYSRFFEQNYGNRKVIG
jgi:dTDP-glucose 4,6-dehydratase